jgi:hypothetical protein
VCVFRSAFLQARHVILNQIAESIPFESAF